MGKQSDVDPIDYDKLRPTVTRSEFESHVHEIAMLRRRMTKLESRLDAITNNQLAEFAKLNMASVLGYGTRTESLAPMAKLAVDAARALVDELEARG